MIPRRRREPGPPKPSGLPFLVIAVAVPLLLACFTFWLANEHGREEQARLQSRASSERRVLTIELLSDMRAAESAQRGNTVTGDPIYLADYVPLKRAVYARFDQLARAFGDEPSQSARLATLRGLADAKFAEMERVRTIRLAQGFDAASRRARGGLGQHLMEQMRALATRMVSDEQIELNRRIADFNRRTAESRRVVWVMGGLVSLLLAVALALLWLQQRSRYRAEVQAFAAAERNRAILDSTNDAIVILDPEGAIETINAAATRMLGYRIDEVTGRNVTAMMPFSDTGQRFSERIGLVDGALTNTFHGDRQIRHRDGRLIPVDVSLGVMALPDGEHIVASVRDVSERKRVERIKDELISTVSHELRTPLTSVVGSLGLLRAGSAGTLPAPATRLIEIAENNSRRLIRLINDMLDIDRIESGKLSIARAAIDMRDVVARAREGSEGLAHAAGITIGGSCPDQPVMVTGDADRLLQVITNLASNAVRVSPPGGVVAIGLVEEGGKAVVTVDDDGSGVPTEFRDRIFGRFERPQNEEGAGTGLGLAISREIVSRHDGRIWFEDRPEGGTRFAFSLELRRRAPSPAMATRALLCAQDRELAATITALASAEGCAVTRVAGAAAAREAVAAARFGLILLDLGMEREGGLSLARLLREEDENVPIILVAAQPGEAPPASLDMVDWLDKPVDGDRLRGAIRHALARTGKARATVLHLDDDPDMLDVTASLLAPDADMLKATDLAAARALLARATPDVAILDLKLEQGSGLDLLPMLVGEDGVAVPTILYSAHEVSEDEAHRVDAVLVKGQGSLPNLKATIRRIVASRTG